MEFQRTSSNRSVGGGRMASSLFPVRSMDQYSDFFRQSSNREEGYLDVLFEHTNTWERRWVVFEVNGTDQFLILSQSRSSNEARLSISMDDVVSFRTDHSQGSECITMKTTECKYIFRATSKEDMQKWLFVFQRSVAFVLSHLLEGAVKSKSPKFSGLGGAGSSGLGLGGGLALGGGGALGGGSLSKGGNSSGLGSLLARPEPPPNPFVRIPTLDPYSDSRPPQPGLGSGLQTLGQGMPGSVKGDSRFAVHGKHIGLERRRNSLKGLDVDSPTHSYGSPSHNQNGEGDSPLPLHRPSPIPSPSASYRGPGGFSSISSLSSSLQSGPSLLSQSVGGGFGLGFGNPLGGPGRGLGGGALTRSTAIDPHSPPPQSQSSSPSILSRSLTNSSGIGGSLSAHSSPQPPILSGLGLSRSKPLSIGTGSSEKNGLSLSMAKSPAIPIAIFQELSPQKLASSYKADIPPPPIRLSAVSLYDSEEDDPDPEEEEEDFDIRERMAMTQLEGSDDEGGTWRDCEDYAEDSDENKQGPSDGPQFALDEDEFKSKDSKNSLKNKGEITINRQSRSSPISSPVSFYSSSPSPTFRTSLGFPSVARQPSFHWTHGSCTRLGPRKANEDRFVCVKDLQALAQEVGMGTTNEAMLGSSLSESSLLGRHSASSTRSNNSNNSSNKKKSPRSPSFSTPTIEGFFGVYDGHCGDQASIYLQQNLHLSILSHPSYSTDLETAILESCIQADKDFLQICRRDKKYAGTTALGAVIRDNRLTVFNIGDCHAIAYLEGEVSEEEGESIPVPPQLKSNSTGEEPNADESLSSSPPLWNVQGGRVVDLSIPHKPGRVDERERISNARGWITEEKELYMGRLHIMDLSDPAIRDKAQKVNWVVIHRVCGELAISRSIGDPDYKGFVPGEKAEAFFLWPPEHDQVFMADLVIPVPEFKSLPLSPSLRFVLMASDGLWDVLTSQEAAQTVRSALARGLSPDAAAAEVCDLALRLGSADNVTAVLISFEI